MIFIVRTETGNSPPFDIKLARITPPSLAESAGRSDFFCLGDPEIARAANWPVVAVHDGWYADDVGGGMAIWGQGMFWEVRDTPFTIKEACGAEAWPAQTKPHQDSDVNVRQAIFRG